MSTYSFDGKNALVTGSTSGIGRDVALKLAAGGAHVIVSGSNRERGDAVVAEIRAAEGSAIFIGGAIDSIEGVRTLASEALAAGNGRIDLLVNNAGVFPFNATVDVTSEEFDSVFGTNVKAPYFVLAALACRSMGRARRRCNC